MLKYDFLPEKKENVIHIALHILIFAVDLPVHKHILIQVRSKLAACGQTRIDCNIVFGSLYFASFTPLFRT